jgi:hypothetical protein
MQLERPDLSGVSPEVLAYIEALEAALDDADEEGSRSPRQEAPLEPSPGQHRC